MIILISDANIIIDMEEGGLLRSISRLPHIFKIPDILFYDELQEQHAHLLENGFILGELTPETMLYALTLTEKTVGPSRNDCFALSLAKQENCSLLTGDRDLRSLAAVEGIDVKGTIWIVEELVGCELVSIVEAENAYRKMETAGRRLPWQTAYGRLNQLKKASEI